MEHQTARPQSSFSGLLQRLQPARDDARAGEGILSYLMYTALVVGALITILSMFRTSQDDGRIRRAENQLAVIMKSMSDAFGASGTVTAGSLNSALISANKAPSDAVAGGTLVTPWGGSITVTGSGSSTYTVTFGSLPPAACTSMASRPNSSAQQSIQIGSNAAATNIDFGTASSQCAGGQSVTWTLVP